MNRCQQNHDILIELLLFERKGGADDFYVNSWRGRKGRGWIKAIPQLNGLESVRGEQQKQ